MSSAFELAYARWCGEPAPRDVGPMKGPAARADDVDGAFDEWDAATAPRDTTPRCRSR
jgi:hypothetical protein